MVAPGASLAPGSRTPLPSGATTPIVYPAHGSCRTESPLVYPARTISPMAKQVAAPVRYGAYAMKAGVPMSPAAGPVPGHVTFGAVVMNGPGNAERGCGRCVNHSSDILTLEGFMWG
eukprot:g32304.t1